MKGVVKYEKGVGKIELQEVPEPSPLPGQVKIKVKAAGLCGTDWHILQDRYPYNPPVVLGHEMAGVVAEVGKGVTHWKVGDRVSAEPFFYTCGGCEYCMSGRPNLCPQRLSIGSGVNGAFTSCVVIGQERVHRLPDNIDFLAGALTEPLATCVHSLLECSRIYPNDVVVVFGSGPIGLLCAQVARSCGARVYLCGIGQDKEKLALAQKELGIEHTVNLEEMPIEPLIEEVTSGMGADVIIEASGAAAAFNTGLTIIKKGGRFAQMGLFGKPVESELDQLVMKELTLTGSFGSRWTSWERALELMARGLVKTRSLISHVLSLDEWEKGFELMGEKRKLKILFGME